MLWAPDILAQIRLLSTEEGGKRMAVSPSVRPDFGCPIELNGEFFDIRFDLSGIKAEIKPGMSALLPAKFLFPKNVLPKLSVGDEFRMWEGKVIGEGKVISIFNSSNSQFDTDAQARRST